MQYKKSSVGSVLLIMDTTYLKLITLKEHMKNHNVSTNLYTTITLLLSISSSTPAPPKKKKDNYSNK